MSRDMTDQVEFTIACVNEFAQRHGMTNVAAFRYLDSYKGLDYIVSGYESLRCQPLELTLEDLRVICRRNGGLAA